jgi:hypothetical protein
MSSYRAVTEYNNNNNNNNNNSLIKFLFFTRKPNSTQAN